MKAILDGFKKRAEQGGSKPVYVHTSGTSVIAKGNDGSFVKEAEKIFDDSSEDDVKNIKPEALHREGQYL